jgi:protocatechuate 3,4-dioxygenase beta subunit
MKWTIPCGWIAAAIVSIAAAGNARLPIQDPPRDVSTPVRATGVLSGVVVSDDTNLVPIRQAIVTLNGAGVAETTTTDDRGAFVFDGLPAGRFTLSASKAAYVTSAWGATRPNGPGTPIVLAQGEARRDLTVRLTHGAVLTGQVRDQFGLPAPHQSVFALQLRWVEGRRVLRPVAAESGSITYASPAAGYHAAMTDDRGLYRLYGLAPGEYLVVVRYAQSFATVARHQTNADDIARAELLLRASASRGTPMAYRDPTISTASTSSAPTDFVGFAPVYYPGTLVAGDAGKLKLGPGEERTGIDVTLESVRTATVRGHIVDRAGRPAANVLIQLVSADAELGPGQSYGDSRPTTGQFTLSNIPPGHYRLEARSLGTPAAGEAPGWAERELTIDGRDVSDVLLTVAPMLTIHGRVVVTPNTADSKAAEAATLTLTPVDAVAGSWTRPLKTTSKDGSFTFENVTPGKYQLACSSSRESLWLATVSVAGANVIDDIVDLRPGVDDIVLTFRDDPTTLRGSLQDTSGAPASGFSAVVFSTSRTDWRWQSRRVREIRLADDGTFSFAGLPPGDYWLAVVNAVELNQWFDPDFLEAAVPGAVKVTLRPGQTTVQGVRVAGR